jgi:peptidoglycan hydrolase-like protein with peptidoglycan-binding domain
MYHEERRMRMKRGVGILFLAVLIAAPLMIVGCKAKTEKPPEEAVQEQTTAAATATQEEAQVVQTTEPAQNVAVETIPPTAAAPQAPAKSAIAAQAEKPDRNKEVQQALKAAGFYAGPVDGKIGPKTKKAIEEFQKSRGLKADGKVGPRTWAELEKVLNTPTQ